MDSKFAFGGKIINKNTKSTKFNIFVDFELFQKCQASSGYGLKLQKHYKIPHDDLKILLNNCINYCAILFFKYEIRVKILKLLYNFENDVILFLNMRWESQFSNNFPDSRTI